VSERVNIKKWHTQVGGFIRYVGSSKKREKDEKSRDEQLLMTTLCVPFLISSEFIEMCLNGVSIADDADIALNLSTEREILTTCKCFCGVTIFLFVFCTQFFLLFRKFLLSC
jgi:hypothetical protein